MIVTYLDADHRLLLWEALEALAPAEAEDVFVMSIRSATGVLTSIVVTEPPRPKLRRPERPTAEQLNRDGWLSWVCGMGSRW